MHGTNAAKTVSDTVETRTNAANTVSEKGPHGCDWMAREWSNSEEKTHLPFWNSWRIAAPKRAYSVQT